MLRDPRRFSMRKKTKNPYDGYSAELLSQWLEITLNYAKRLKTGHGKASKHLQVLFELASKQQRLGEKWEGWRFVEKSLWTPEDKEITQGDIRALPYLKALQASLTRGLQGEYHESNNTRGVVLDFRPTRRLATQRPEQPYVPVPRKPNQRQ